MGLLDGFRGIAKDTNKVGSTGSTDSVVSELLPELALSMDDKELLQLSRDWTKAWAAYETEILKKQEENENYWLGKQFGVSRDKAACDNLIFESLETFLPIATRPKADPLVESDNSENGNAIADKVRKMLIYVSDTLSYNLKIKQVARYWALYMLGVMKVGWSMKENDLTCVAIRPQKLILDPKATIEEGEYTGYYIGEKMEDMASDLVLRFPTKTTFIKDKVKDKMGTKLSYTMWTTDDYVFWTLDSEVLAKNKNPHWNYPTQQPAPMNEFGSQPVDETGKPMMQDIEGRNHFKSPKKPYVFLSIFNLGKNPHDDTNLIQQNLPLQDLVNKRLSQIDKNADNTNGGLVISGDAFTEAQAKKAGEALRKGGVIYVPTGDVNTAVKRDASTALPNFVYESLIDYRNEIRNIFGTRGSSPQGTIQEQTVGGKNIIKNQDTDRIGGGISSYLEQFSDNVFNWFVQLMYVYYDEQHYASVMGSERAKEYISLQSSEFGNLKLLVGVKEGSMIPHDPVSQRGEAMELWAEKGIDPITFFDRLEFPNPRESAKNLFLWLSDPVQLFPDLAAAQQQAQAQQMATQQSQIAQQNQAQSGQIQQQAQLQAVQQAQTGQQQQQMAAEQHQRDLQKIAFQNLTKQA